MGNKAILRSIVWMPDTGDVSLVLRQCDGGYSWTTADGQECGIGVHENTHDAKVAAIEKWGKNTEWELKAKWARP
jgi:hypothetical protein